jgi:hypothetical protein
MNLMLHDHGTTRVVPVIIAIDQCHETESCGSGPATLPLIHASKT